ncbi:pantoate--beta-alanine ligase [Porphyrobacter sp. GA68]|uniref:pantoate--beta-alanine ligase n=1 Tax=Porphyrobacter sp. GA68 TaxID=2883480 RepID=UPI001D191F6E|nr:pantoate--beta-alanine ligase [Porphyrobacter sp. GA68]
MQIIRQLEMLRSAVAAVRERGGSLALAPTMGALHQGHLTLVREARRMADAVAVSIFVNPRQFGPSEDLDSYPRQLERDADLLRSEGVAILWAPDAAVMYPPDYATDVSVAGVSEPLCGANRPGHFDGVATVVLKLFNQVRPDCALFGEKDWQQLAVIRRMARDLDLTQPDAAAIHAVPTVREEDGLAMSSRNAYLSPEQRARAAALPQLMRQAAAAIANGEAAQEVLTTLRSDLLGAGFEQVDYAELRDGQTLHSVAQAQPGSRLFVAARIGGTRLIDNLAV